MSEFAQAVQAVVDFLSAHGFDGTVRIGGVVFDYLSLAFGGLVGFVIGLMLG